MDSSHPSRVKGRSLLAALTFMSTTVLPVRNPNLCLFYHLLPKHAFLNTIGCPVGHSEVGSVDSAACKLAFTPVVLRQPTHSHLERSGLQRLWKHHQLSTGNKTVCTASDEKQRFVIPPCVWEKNCGTQHPKGMKRNAFEKHLQVLSTFL